MGREDPAHTDTGVGTKDKKPKSQQKNRAWRWGRRGGKRKRQRPRASCGGSRKYLLSRSKQLVLGVPTEKKINPADGQTHVDRRGRGLGEERTQQYRREQRQRGCREATQRRME